MADRSFLAWPFFDEAHRTLAGEVEKLAAGLGPLIDHAEPDRTCQALVRALGQSGLLGLSVIAPHGGRAPRLDVRSLCLARELLAYEDGLADFAFAMQGLGSGPISLFGSEAQKARFLPAVAAGELICGFALTEPAAGSDAGRIATTRAARRATLSSSTAPRPGSRTAALPTSTWSSPAPARRRAPRASRR